MPNLRTMKHVLTPRGVSSHWPGRLPLDAIPVWVMCVGFVWWVLGVRLDAADTGHAEPAGLSQWDGPALILAVCAFVTICACVVLIVRSARRD